MKKIILLSALCFIATSINAQEIDTDNDAGGSVIQTLTPSKLIAKGQFDIKWFNNLFTQTKAADENGDVTKNLPRQTFFTSTLEAYTGVSDSRRVNVGVILEARSNVIADRSATDVFSFDGERGTARSGLTNIAPSVKFVPFERLNNFSVQSSLFIPLFDNEVEDGVFLDQKGFTWQNRFFYDTTLGNGDWQLFAELNAEYNFGKEAVFNNAGVQTEGSFANNSLRLNPGIFLSYFPSSKFTVLGLVQHSQLLDLGSDFTQDFTAVGGGIKYQLTEELNVETLYTNFVRGNSTGLGQTFNLGLRAVF